MSTLQDAINKPDADVVVSGPPIDLSRLIGLNKKAVRARYEYCAACEPTLSRTVGEFLRSALVSGSGVYAGSVAEQWSDLIEVSSLET